MSLKDTWKNKTDGVDDVLAEDINSIAEAVIELEEENEVDKAPYIGENGNWFEWDSQINAFVDTGIRAEGEKGAQGPKGDKGDKGDTPTPDVSTEIPATLAVNTIYELGVQSSLTLNLPQGKTGDFIQVDFLSGETPTTLTIIAGGLISEYDFIPRSNMIYSLYFDWGVLYYDEDVSEYVYGWRFAYAEYVASEV